MNERVYIGLDPGAHTGYALWLPQDKLLRLKTLTFWDAVDELRNAFALYDMLTAQNRFLVVIETPGKIPTSYARHEKEAGGRKLLRINRNVGSANREADLLVQFVRRSGIPVREVVPNSAKIGAAQFSRLTGYTGETNQHMRDAAMLVWGR